MSLTAPKDTVLLMTPIFSSYAACIEALDRKVLTLGLGFQPVEGRETHRFIMDRKEMGEKIREVQLVLLCHPHNPSGRMWRKDELMFILN
jgi:cystathionine beta-lyase